MQKIFWKKISLVFSWFSELINKVLFDFSDCGNKLNNGHKCAWTFKRKKGNWTFLIICRFSNGYLHDFSTEIETTFMGAHVLERSEKFKTHTCWNRYIATLKICAVHTQLKEEKDVCQYLTLLLHVLQLANK